MKQFFCRASALLLALTMAFLSACSQGAAPGGAGGAQPVAMGRYVEEEMTLPQDLGIVSSLSREDDSLVLVANKNPDQVIGPWYMWRSRDGGKTWAEEAPHWLDRIRDASLGAVAWAPDGSVLLYYVIYTDELIAAVNEAVANMDVEAAIALQPDYTCERIAPDGTVTPITLDLPEDEFGRPISLNDITCTDGGDLLCESYYDGIYQLDGATGKRKNTFLPEGGRAMAALPMGGRLAVAAGNEIALYSLESGEKEETVAMAQESERCSLATDGDALYYCDPTGIYRRVEGGAVLEQVVDGSLTSLTMPAMGAGTFLAGDGEFLILFSGSGYTLMNYRYDETISTVPTRELRVYSLQDNKNIRQAMGVFQRRNPDTHVVLEVGLPEDGSITVSDALRSLSTQLLSGKGPDLLVLDGMPVDSYIDKGVLQDLSQFAGDKAASGELLPNIVEAMRRSDGKLYALPARFTVPMMLSGDEAPADSLSSLCRYMLEVYEQNPQMAQDSTNPIFPVPELMLTTFYPVCAPAWRAEDGSIREEEFSQFLSDLKSVTDYFKDEAANWEPWGAVPGSDYYELGYGAAFWLYDHAPLSFGPVYDMTMCVAPCEAAIRQKGEGKLTLLPGQASGVFIPKSLIGLSAASPNQEAALNFLDILFSADVLANEFEDGLPVNQEALERNSRNPYPPTDDGMIFGTDDYSEMLQVIWPSEEYMADILELLRSLDTAADTDRVAAQMVIDETREYFNGHKSLEDTVSAVVEKMNLYLAE